MPHISIGQYNSDDNGEIGKLANAGGHKTNLSRGIFKGRDNRRTRLRIPKLRRTATRLPSLSAKIIRIETTGNGRDKGAARFVPSSINSTTCRARSLQSSRKRRPYIRRQTRARHILRARRRRRRQTTPSIRRRGRRDDGSAATAPARGLIVTPLLIAARTTRASIDCLHWLRAISGCTQNCSFSGPRVLDVEYTARRGPVIINSGPVLYLTLEANMRPPSRRNIDGVSRMIGFDRGGDRFSRTDTSPSKPCAL